MKERNNKLEKFLKENNIHGWHALNHNLFYSNNFNVGKQQIFEIEPNSKPLLYLLWFSDKSSPNSYIAPDEGELIAIPEKYPDIFMNNNNNKSKLFIYKIINKIGIIGRWELTLKYTHEISIMFDGNNYIKK